MKVCTDSCLFGAWVPVEQAQTILDVGTGTGLLALMAAQRSSAHIQAVEIDIIAAEQAHHNFTQSPWADRLALFSNSLQAFEQVNTVTFDIIISNPPFYQASQKSPDQARNRAMHTMDLPFPDLLHFCQKFLNPSGSLYLLLPPHEAQVVTALAASYQLFLIQELPVYTQEGGKLFRRILRFGFHEQLPEYLSPIYIRTPENNYTQAFEQILQPYYLNF
ncbi:tRNA1(Val) (adenine(37)-N6)-methyltransferase [Adhaeribacter pallidiroseus]|uniref:tRNA1(Val) (adenine(37)-N6)-methyltransferase n=1 Tax=Adhaeribacter pallidiroseus TaxID=2072847 RepID=A0A369QKZ1_9BACT|nr:methyltransferase [Adhaeribacter pallidiroseus]RDC63509.1 tRNA(1)(Val) (adenine(37)-N(6))-methyltransferase [Adhaeribacter pallidiroseus]